MIYENVYNVLNDNFMMFFFKKSYWCCFVEIIKEVIVNKFILIYIIEVV